MESNCNTLQNRVAFNFEETARLFGHERAWTYRQVKLGRLKPLKGYGKMMISAEEIQRVLKEGQP